MLVSSVVIPCARRVPVIACRFNAGIIYPSAAQNFQRSCVRRDHQESHSTAPDAAFMPNVFFVQALPPRSVSLERFGLNSSPSFPPSTNNGKHLAIHAGTSAYLIAKNNNSRRGRWKPQKPSRRVHLSVKIVSSLPADPGIVANEFQRLVPEQSRPGRSRPPEGSEIRCRSRSRAAGVRCWITDSITGEKTRDRSGAKCAITETARDDHQVHFGRSRPYANIFYRDFDDVFRRGNSPYRS